MKQNIRYSLLSFVAFLLMVIPMEAQKHLDDAYLKCQYDYQYEEDTLSHQLCKDRLVLLVGKNVSKCYSYYSMHIDSIFASPDRDEILRLQINAAIGAKQEWPHKRMKAYIYKNYPEGCMTVTDGLLSQDYVYQDTLNGQEWNVIDSVKMILGHECQLATCFFRGHRWTAWFATDIPVGDGPWKLSGLPGLIMEAEAKKNSHVFRLVGIEKVSDTTKEPIVFSKTYVGNHQFEKINLPKFLKKQYQFLFGNQTNQVQLETGIEISSSSSGKKNGRKYKPLEIL